VQIPEKIAESRDLRTKADYRAQRAEKSRGEQRRAKERRGE
jgi:hypothetical protein